MQNLYLDSYYNTNYFLVNTKNVLKVKFCKGGNILHNEIIVNSIKSICKERGITIGELEKTVGLSQGLVSKWAKSSPSLDKIIDIADYFHISLDEVVGREINNDKSSNDDITISLMMMTTNNEIQWDFIEDYGSQNINGELYEDTFNLYSEKIEVFKCRYESSFLFLVAQYELEQGVVEDLSITLYLQPDENSNPVIQEINDEKMIQEFWIEVRKPYMGIPDEWKANIIKQKIIGRKDELMFGHMTQYLKNVPSSTESINEFLVDEKAKKIMTEDDSPEIRKLINMFTNPQMVQAMKSAQKLIQYFEDVGEIKKNNDK